jgi:hypothetical protein
MIAFAVALTALLPAAAEDGIGFGRAAPTPRQDAVLSGALATVRQMSRQGGSPVCIFDLDATLFEAGCRHKTIFKELARANRRDHPAMAAIVASWVPDDLPYAVTDMFTMAGLRSSEARTRAFEFWRKRFFSNEYLRFDHPVAGGVSFVNALSKAGAVIVYLTGRQECQMLDGTIATLKSAGYPFGPGRGVLLMSSRSGVRDDTFKGSPGIQQTIGSLGTTVAIFDNEPGNCNALQKSFPGALTVLLDTNHSPSAPPPDAGIPVIKNFRWSWLTKVSRNAD